MKNINQNINQNDNATLKKLKETVSDHLGIDEEEVYSE